MVTWLLDWLQSTSSAQVVSDWQLDECRAEARVKDRELEESEERHQTEVKVYKQKVKHLLYEQENHLADLKAENMVSYKHGGE